MLTTLAEAAGWEPSWLDVLLTWVVGTVIVGLIAFTFIALIWLIVMVIKDAIRGDLW